ncbi:MAG: response regulator [Desulfobacteraceae bacterium]|nr:MAG: response regulator [Desulfobacteraceae bacterium]
MIMDPGINGRETYSRALVIRPEQKAIIVSGFAQTEEVLEAKRLGTVQFLRKPVSIEKIGLAVKKALGMVVSAKQSPQL